MAFINQVYEPWAIAHLKTGKDACARMRHSFEKLLKRSLNEVTAHEVEKWRGKRLGNGIRATTVNRELNDLKAAMNWSVQKTLSSHPLKLSLPLLFTKGGSHDSFNWEDTYWLTVRHMSACIL